MPHYLFVTGRLAEQPLRRLLESLAPQVGFEYSVAVMPITIAALITPRWLARRLEVPTGVTEIIVPGHCEGELATVEEVAKIPVQRGPRDFRQLPEYFGRKGDTSQYGAWDIEIIAKISKADLRSTDELLDEVANLASDGADVVLLSGSGKPWPNLPETVEELREDGHRVAVEDVTPLDLLSSIPRGIEMVFPGDRAQQEAATGLGCEVALINKDEPHGEFSTLVEAAVERGIALRIDPGLPPIGQGLATSIGRYLRAREQWPKIKMVMSVDRLTTSVPVDSASLHFLLMGLCEELGVGSVVVSQEANWCQSAVRECHLARQMTCFAQQTNSLSHEIESGLLMLRDATVLEFGRDELDRLAEVLRDPSPRLYSEGGQLHAVSAGRHLASDDPYDLFDQIQSNTDRTFDANQAFYLGYEMAKAMTARTLGKTYRQDEALDWGLLTQRELTRLERRALRLARLRDGECEEAQQYYDEDDLDGDSEDSNE